MRNAVSARDGRARGHIAHAEGAHARQLAIDHHAVDEPGHVLLAHEFFEHAVEAGEDFGRIAWLVGGGCRHEHGQQARAARKEYLAFIDELLSAGWAAPRGEIPA